MSIAVEELRFDDENEAECAAHGVSVAEVIQVLIDEPRFYRNAKDKRASHLMLGPTFSGRLLLVPIEQVGEGVWRPVTAYEPSAHQRGRYQQERR